MLQWFSYVLKLVIHWLGYFLVFTVTHGEVHLCCLITCTLFS